VSVEGRNQIANRGLTGLAYGLAFVPGVSR
jgi:hypothetical protein